MIGTIFFLTFGYIAFILVGSIRERNGRIEEYWASCPKPEVDEHDIVIKGKHIPFAESDAWLILSKRFPYYANLSDDLKRKFEHRLLKFMKGKTFIIKNGEGFREMPVLV